MIKIESGECYYITDTDHRIAKLADKYKFPGWYFDANGSYCCNINKYLISIFINDCDNSIDITCDTIGESGYFDENLEWETANNEVSACKTACKFMKKYSELR